MKASSKNQDPGTGTEAEKKGVEVYQLLLDETVTYITDVKC